MRLAALLDAGSLAAQVAHVVQLRATYVTLADDLNLLQVRGVYREGTLNTDTEGNLADRERLTDAVTLTTNDEASEDLGTGNRTLDNLDVYVEGIARTEVRDIVAQLACVYKINNAVAH